MSASPVRSGLIGMMGTFIDTIVVCSMTGLAIVVSGAWTTGTTGAELTQIAFQSAMPGVGDEIVALSLAVFALTTIFGWSYYGERCWQFLVGPRAIVPYRILWTVAVFFGAVTQLDLAWTIADTLNALMAVPNLISLIALSPIVGAAHARAAAHGARARPGRRLAPKEAIRFGSSLPTRTRTACSRCRPARHRA